jgi:hypothetical protein
MLSARENYCPDQVTFSGAEPSHPTTVVVCPAIRGGYIKPVCYLLKFMQKPLLLKLLAFEYNARLKGTSSSSNSLNK